MSNSMNFVFDGEFRRRPEQNLGGRRNTESRQEVVRRAQTERFRRELHCIVFFTLENGEELEKFIKGHLKHLVGTIKRFLIEFPNRLTHGSTIALAVEKLMFYDFHGLHVGRDRQIASAIVVLQSYARTFIVRKTLKNALRTEFDQNIRDSYTMKELANQSTRINYFFACNTDQQRFFNFVKVVLLNRVAIIEKCGQDLIWVLRIRGILRNCLAYYDMAFMATCVRLYEVFTDDSNTSESSLIQLTNLWINMIAEGNFFAVWRGLMEARCQIMLSDGIVRHELVFPLAKAFLGILDRPLKLVSKLILTSQQFRIRKFVVDGQETAKLILEMFTLAFGTQVLPNNDMYNYSDLPRNGVGTYLVLPYLARNNFPYSVWIRYLSSKPTFGDLGTTRNVLYSFLSLTTPINAWANPTDFFRALLSMIYSVDPERNPPRQDKYREVDNDDDMVWAFVPDQVYMKFHHQAIYVFDMLIPLMNSLPIVCWIDSNFDENWELICPIVSIMARFERKRNLKDCTFLSVLAYKRDTMRNLYSRVEKTRTETNIFEPCMTDVFVFCFLFTHLMSTLHDAEFVPAMPMERHKLTAFVIYLKEIYSNIIIHGRDESLDPFLYVLGQMVTNTLMLLYERNTRIPLFLDGTFLSNSLRAISPVLTHSLEFQDFKPYRDSHQQPPVSLVDQKLLRILVEFPFCLSFHERVSAWHRLLDLDRAQRYSPHGLREQVQIRRSHIYEDAYEKLSPENVPDLRDNIRISLVNIVGAQEAGVDGGGLLREFLSEATRAGVDPNRGLFRLDSQNRIYPNPVAKKIDPKYREHFFLMGRLVGKALYEQTLLELPLAAFFIQTCITGKIESAVDYLATLDPGLHKNLLALKTYNGDWNALGLDFTVTLEEFGDKRTVELKKNGASISVDMSNVIEYIHLIADYKMNKEMESECWYFRSGLFDVVPILKMFSWREMQTLISGSDKAIDINDWKKYTHYAGGYGEEHPTIVLFWQVLREFSETHLRKLLKFVTSCSRPPILGFKDLVPNFGIQNAGPSDRLPTAATCMNLLKLPEFTELEVLREKLIYAIDAQAGFELS